MLKHLPLLDPKIRTTKCALVDCCCSADSGRLEATGKVGSSNQPCREEADALRFVVTVQRIRGARGHREIGGHNKPKEKIKKNKNRNNPPEGRIPM